MMMSYSDSMSISLPLKIDIVKNLGNIECVRNIIDQVPADPGLGADFFNLSSFPDYVEDNIIHDNVRSVDINNKSYHSFNNIIGMEGDRQPQLLDISSMNLEDFVDVTRDNKYVDCSIIGIVSEEEQLSSIKPLIQENYSKVSAGNATPLVFQNHNLNSGRLKLIKSNINVEDDEDTSITHVKSLGSNNEINISSSNGERSFILKDNDDVIRYMPIDSKELSIENIDINSSNCKDVPHETYDIIKFSTLNNMINLLDYVDVNDPLYKVDIEIDGYIVNRSAILIANHLFSSVRAINHQSMSSGDIYASGGIGKIMMSLLSLQTLFLMIAIQCISYYYNKDVRNDEKKIIFSDGSNILIEILKLNKGNIFSLGSDLNFSSLTNDFIKLIIKYDDDLYKPKSRVVFFLNQLYIKHIKNLEVKKILSDYISNPEKSHSKIRYSMLNALSRLA